MGHLKISCIKFATCVNRLSPFMLNVFVQQRSPARCDAAHGHVRVNAPGTIVCGTRLLDMRTPGVVIR